MRRGWGLDIVPQTSRIWFISPGLSRTSMHTEFFEKTAILEEILSYKLATQSLTLNVYQTQKFWMFPMQPRVRPFY